MVTNYPQQLTAGSRVAHGTTDNVIARAMGRLGQLFCGLRGHDSVLHFEANRVNSVAPRADMTRQAGKSADADRAGGLKGTRAVTRCRRRGWCCASRPKVAAHNQVSASDASASRQARTSSTRTYSSVL